jgi:hypothetical protein
MKLFKSQLSSLLCAKALREDERKAAERRHAEYASYLQPHAKPWPSQAGAKAKSSWHRKEASEVARIQKGEAQEIKESGHHSPKTILRTGVQPENTVLVVSKNDWRIA